MKRSPASYDAYARAVREEYAYIADEARKRGRPAVLKKFLEAKIIYPNPVLRQRFEVRARENLAREIASLG